MVPPASRGAEDLRCAEAIQSHGALVVCDRVSFQVAHISANALEFFGTEVADSIGNPVHALFHWTERDSVIEMVAFARSDEYRHRSVKNPHGVALDCVVYRSALTVVIEVEKVRAAERPGFETKAHACLVRLSRARNAITLVERAVRELRDLTGFDRVMLYRLATDSSARVFAEAKSEHLESFVGLHYPARTMQAWLGHAHASRRLHVIADVECQGVPMQPTGVDEARPALDQAHLRRASNNHLRDLRGWGVKASASVPLTAEGRLVGFLACHHYGGPRMVPHAWRETIECAAQILACSLNVLAHEDSVKNARLAAQAESEVADSLVGDENLLDRIATLSLCAMTQAAGAAVVLTEGIRTVGIVPDTQAVSELVQWLRTRTDALFSTHHLTEHLPVASGWTNQAAGVIAVTLCAELGEYLIWFRPSTERVVEWAANPNLPRVPAQSGDWVEVVHRGRQVITRQTTHDRCVPWEEWQLTAASKARALVVAAGRRQIAKLRYVNQRLLDADRAKDLMLATISHELRNPLAAIAGWSRLYLDGGLPVERRDDAVRIVARNTQVLTNLVDDLLDASRMLSGNVSLEVEKVELTSLVESVVTSMSVATDAKGVRVTTDLPETAESILGDSVRLRQVVSNLLSNAIKFTPKGGRIDLTLVRLGSDVELSVCDTGIGLAPDSIERIFETFWQVDSSTVRKEKGIGLGLSIVKHLVELHGGTVSAASAGLGRGACFRVLLPLASTKFAASRPPPPPADFFAPGHQLEGVKILLVEDEDDARTLVRNILERAGALVVDVASAQTALRTLEATSFNVLVSDIAMPDMDGVQLISEVRANTSLDVARLPAVALTAYTRAADRSTALWSGFQAHVAKPIDLNELIAVVSSVAKR